MAWQGERRFAIAMQNRLNRAVESYIATRMGYRNTMVAADRERLFKLATKLRQAVERGQEPPPEAGSVGIRAAHLILRNHTSRESWDLMRQDAERRMTELAEMLPVWSWVEGVRGVSSRGLAVIVGEAGDLGSYPRKGHLFKRLGITVMDDGFRQGRVPPGLTKAERAEAWIERGYNPRRRAEVWALLDDVMLRAQWQGGAAKGPYGAYYIRKKTEYLGRGWQPKHADDAARRYMAKMFIRDLWKRWRRLAAAGAP
jgi:hypothetical protein